MRLISTMKFIWKHPLNRSDRLAALSRFVRWQLGSRLLQSTISLPFINDTALFARRGMTGATGNWYCGLHEHRDMGFVLHLLRPNDLFLDVGANVGSYTVLAAGAVGAEVIAVEPIPSTFSNLKLNVALNQIDSLVDAHCAGVSDKCGFLRFTTDLDTVNHVATESELSGAIEVPVVTVDELCVGRSPVAIKIDVEGYEQFVLTGAAKTLDNPALLAVVMETNQSGSRYDLSDQKLVGEMKHYGFLPFTYDPLSRSVIEVIDGEGNTIFIRDVAAVEARTRKAPRFRLVNGDI
jgi:FkbM family methyltransferase